MRIIRSKFRISPQYKKFGPWKVDLFDGYEDDYLELSKEDQNRVDKIIKQLELYPY